MSNAARSDWRAGAPARAPPTCRPPLRARAAARLAAGTRSAASSPRSAARLVDAGLPLAAHRRRPRLAHRRTGRRVARRDRRAGCTTQGLQRALARRAAGGRRRRAAARSRRSSARVVRVLGITTQAVHLVGFAPDGRGLGPAARLRQGDRPGPAGTRSMGGQVGAGESIEATLERETQEEAGLAIADLLDLAPAPTGSRCAGRSPRATWSSTSRSFERDCSRRRRAAQSDGEVERFECLRSLPCSSGSAAGAFTLEATLILDRLGWRGAALADQASASISAAQQRVRRFGHHRVAGAERDGARIEARRGRAPRPGRSSGRARRGRSSSGSARAPPPPRRRDSDRRPSKSLRNRLVPRLRRLQRGASGRGSAPCSQVPGPGYEGLPASVECENVLTLSIAAIGSVRAASSSAAETSSGTRSPTRTRCETRSGARAAASSAISEPMLWPTSGDAADAGGVERARAASRPSPRRSRAARRRCARGRAGRARARRSRGARTSAPPASRRCGRGARRGRRRRSAGSRRTACRRCTRRPRARRPAAATSSFIAAPRRRAPPPSARASGRRPGRRRPRGRSRGGSSPGRCRRARAPRRPSGSASSRPDG